VIKTLVVDDDFRVAELHAEFVGRIEGFRVSGVARSSQEALDAVAEQRPDLVLLDIYLPDESGLSLLRRLREGDGPHPDVIAITAARDLTSIRIAMQRGVVSYLVKPFPFRMLRDRLDTYRTLWQQTRSGGDVAQGDVDRLFGLMRGADTPARLPKGHSEPTMSLVRAAFDDGDTDLSAADVASRTGVSRATAQRYLSLLVRSGFLDLRLRYGATGRPEHRYSPTRN
jgi:response regulator of citrate/malate metabolism